MSAATVKQLIRFGVIGCINSGITYVVFLLSYRYFPLSKVLPVFSDSVAGSMVTSLHLIGLSTIDGAVANVIGYIAGMVNSFVWNKLWTFKAANGTKKQLFRFIITNITCLLASTSIIFICIDLYHWPYNPVWIITMIFVTMINFVASKYWIFARDAHLE